MFFQFVCIEIGWSGCDLCTRNCFHSSHSHHIFRYCFSSRLLSFAIHIAARHSRAYLKKSSHRQCRDEFSSISIQSNVPITRSELAFDLWTWWLNTLDLLRFAWCSVHWGYKWICDWRLIYNSERLFLMLERIKSIWDKKKTSYLMKNENNNNVICAVIKVFLPIQRVSTMSINWIKNSAQANCGESHSS